MKDTEKEEVKEKSEEPKKQEEKNEKTYNVIGTEKKKGIKKYVIFIIIYAIIAISVTAYLIYAKKIKNENNILDNIIGAIQEIKNPVKDSVQASPIGSKYDQNDLVTENIVKEEKINGSDVYISYYIIKDGLKDENIKNKINKEIEDEIKNVDIEEYSKKYGRINISASVTANFSNVFSVMFDIWGYNDGEIGSDSDTEYKFLNYNLENGEQIKFKDLFVESADIKNIITQSAYNSLIETEYFYEYSNDLELDMSKVDSSKLEDEVLEIVSDYNLKKDSSDLKFAFSPKNIYLQLANRIITIDMSKFADKIAIYNRFKTAKNLYKTSSIGAKGVYTYVERYTRPDDYNFIGEKYDNVYVNILINAEYSSWSSENLRYEEIPEEQKTLVDRAFVATKNFINDKIDEYKNTKEPVYLSFYASVYSNSNEKVPYSMLYFQEVDMSQDFYENKMDEAFAQCLIDMSDSADVLGSLFLDEYFLKGYDCKVKETIDFQGDEIFPEGLFEEEENKEEPTNEVENNLIQNVTSNNVVNELKNETTNENIVENNVVENEITNELTEEPVPENTVEDEESNNEINENVSEEDSEENIL